MQPRRSQATVVALPVRSVIEVRFRSGGACVATAPPLLEIASGNVMAKVAAGTIAILVVKEGVAQVTSSIVHNAGHGQGANEHAETAMKATQPVTVRWSRLSLRRRDLLPSWA